MWTLGALVALVPFTYLVTTRTWNFSGRVQLGDDFYDAQARSVLDGRWDVPLDVVAIEGFERDKKFYMYFGPTPAFLRIPVIEVFDPDDGAWATQWMMFAYLCAMAALGALAWRIRRLVRRDEPLHLLELGAIGLLALGVGAGSTLLYLGASATVYFEAILWGIACSVAAFASLLWWIERPRWRALLLTVGFTTAAILSRFSIGLGPVIAAGALSALLLGARWWPWLRTRVNPALGVPSTSVSLPVIFTLGAGAVLAVVLHAWLNWVKLRMLFGLPFARQGTTALFPERKAAVDANGGTLFRLRGIPTDVLQYLLRPDAFRLRSGFPWLGSPNWYPRVIGNVVYEPLERMGSLPASMPALAILCAIGLVAVVRARGSHGVEQLARLRLPLLAAFLATLPTLMFLFMAARYIGDWFPFVALGGFAGFFVMFNWCTCRWSQRRGLVIALTALLCALTVFALLLNIGMAFDFQHDHPQLVHSDLVNQPSARP